jgi:hypothetical protein
MFDNDKQFGLKTVTVVAFLTRVQCTTTKTSEIQKGTDDPLPVSCFRYNRQFRYEERDNNGVLHGR